MAFGMFLLILHNHVPYSKNVSGFGFAFAKHFDDLGFVVFAGCLNVKGDGARKLRSECSQRLHVVELDV